MVKKCPNCGNTIHPNNKFCKNCGFKIVENTKANEPKATQQSSAQTVQSPMPQPQQIHHQTYNNPKKHSGAGIASLILGIIPMCLIWACIFSIWFYLIVELPMAILATIFGALAYFGKAKDKFGMAGFILGLLVIVIGLVLSLIPMFMRGY